MIWLSGQGDILVARRALEGQGVRLCVRREKPGIFSGCESRLATGSLRPVAIGAAVEVTKPSEPSRQTYREAVRRTGRP